MKNMNIEQLLIHINKWIEQSEENAEIFRKEGLTSAEITSVAMAQAYWNVKQLIEVNNQI